MSKDYLLKKDLNLLPRKQGPSVLVRVVIPAGFLAIVLIGALAAGIIIPQNIKAQKLARKDEISGRIKSLEYINDEYDTLNGEIEALNSRIKHVDGFNMSDRTISSILDIIEKSCPKGIELTETRFDYEKVKIFGISLSDAEIASFMVNLRSNTLFAKSNIEIVEPNKNIPAKIDSEGKTVPVDMEELLREGFKPRAFEMLLYYPVERPEDGKSAGAKTTKSGGGN